MQQGRVQLDADFNESVAISGRRTTLQAIDTFGHCAVPKTTPDGFQVTAVAGPPADLAIGGGRIYIDGLLAEILPGETYSYLQQPFCPAPPALSSFDGPNGIAYIVVRERELIAIQDGDLLEKALGGVDTTTRLQTIWQLRVHGLGNAAPTCETDFKALFPPSAGRLSTRTMAPPPDPNPCIISPNGGYRGLENQLYRVEVHDPGTAGDIGSVRYKWSRENASVVSAVESIGTSGTQSQLVVARIGRDPILRFRVDDWVEITDDHRELMDEPGEMARITNVNEATRTITLDRAIPAAGGRAFGATTQDLHDRHTRIRRWDQQLNVDSDGLLSASSGWVTLERGIEVKFDLSPSTGSFKIGDYWLFAARTADSSVEELIAAPPVGINRHYCQVATLTGLGPDATPAVQVDCRTLWPPESGCCCTVTVGTGPEHRGDFADLESALTALAWLAPNPNDPVHICLLAGEHEFSAPIAVNRDRVTISGCGPASRIVPTGTALQLNGNEVALESVTISASSDDPLIEINGDRCRVERNRLRNDDGYAIVSNAVSDLTIADNMITEGQGIAIQAQHAMIARNHFARARIDVRVASDDIRVVENEIVEAPGDAAILLGTRQAGDEDQLLFEIDLAQNRISQALGSGIASAEFDPEGVVETQIVGLRIVGNEIVECIDSEARRDDDVPFGGIVLATVHDLVVNDNRIENNGVEAHVAVCGVYVRHSRGFEASHNRILNNGQPSNETEIRGYQGGIIASDATFGSTGSKAEFEDSTAAAIIQNNTIVAPQGQALLLVGVGPMLVLGNRLVARQAAVIGDGANEDSVTLSGLASQVGAFLIVNFGISAYLAPLVSSLGYSSSKATLHVTDILEQIQNMPGGKVQFVHNQVTLNQAESGVKGALAAGLVLSLDDANVSDNQTDCLLGEGWLLYDFMVGGITVRQIGNGLTETLNRCIYSLYSWGLANTVADNQSTHCIFALGARSIERDNIVLLPNPTFCPERK